MVIMQRWCAAEWHGDIAGLDLDAASKLLVADTEQSIRRLTLFSAH